MAHASPQNATDRFDITPPPPTTALPRVHEQAAGQRAWNWKSNERAGVELRGTEAVLAPPTVPGEAYSPRIAPHDPSAGPRLRIRVGPLKLEDVVAAIEVKNRSEF